ncbi:hypothetical protein OCL06_15815 [Alteromonas sp. ASW11-19]|uniref:Tetratricopeptide repeat protein n=1 Tax=Alteromonas salexigens TaxID=2982530 RepID=A0ABT2VT07_9ALTE|nr:hypothetical protein [Alteromonas salexigens]MCU7556058.1 hypothetical protein [Alteromonas salexigens]
MKVAKSVAGIVFGALLTGPVQAAEKPDTGQALSRMHLGNAKYALYHADPFNALTRIAVAAEQPLTPADARQLALLQGSAALGWGMPTQAGQVLQQVLDQDISDEATRVRAHYWLSRLYFSQNQPQQARPHYEKIAGMAASDKRGETHYLSEAQWDKLHYMAANIQVLEDAPESYSEQLSDTDIEAYYLLYNRGVMAFQRNQLREAEAFFAQAQQGLSTHLSPGRKKTQGLMSWLGLSKDNQPEQVSAAEYQALLNQILLARGQTLLAEGKLAQATDAFGQISGQTLARDEALLGYGWALAQGDDWPMAMGVWQFLTEQPENLYTLQARHALGLGYAKHKGYQDALQHFEALDDALIEAVEELDTLKQRVAQPKYWFVIGNALSHDNPGEPLPSAYVTWPQVHRDILKRIVTTEQAQSSYALLQHLRTLSDMRDMLDQKQDDIRQFTMLIDERRVEHARRVSAIDTASHDDTLRTLTEQAGALRERLQKAAREAEQADTDDEYFAAIAQLARPGQQPQLTRLQSASKQLRLLQQHDKAKPAHQARLQRLKGILQWQIDDEFVPLMWQYNKQLDSLDSLRKEAAQRLHALEQLVANPAMFDEQQARVDAAAVQIASRQQEVSQLADTVISTLISRTRQALETRRSYLLEQQTTTRLALLQLRDRWQPDEQGGGQ